MTTLVRLEATTSVGLLGNVDGRHPTKDIDDRREVRDGVIVP